MGEIRTAFEKELKEEIRKYKLVVQDIQRFNVQYGNFQDNTKERILQLMKELDIDKMDGVKKVKTKILPKLSVEKIRSAFNDKDMANLVVVDVDIEKTIENIVLRHGYSNAIAKSFLTLLLELHEFEYENLGVLK